VIHLRLPRLPRPPHRPGRRSGPRLLRLASAVVLSVAFVVVWLGPAQWLGPIATVDDAATSTSDVPPVPPPLHKPVDHHTVMVPPASSEASSSALTARGTGEFENVEVTVSQTASLVNQAIEVSWKGAKITPPQKEFAQNFVQIMQCWGDDRTNGPDRTQCVFGTRSAQYDSGGLYGNLYQRGLVLPPYQGKSRVDPEEGRDENKPTYDSYVPFINWQGRQTSGPDAQSRNPDFDLTTSNEIPGARSYATAGSQDGIGSTTFEVQTDVQSPGLGCGRPISADDPQVALNPEVVKPLIDSIRQCWLVVVLRGRTDVDPLPGETPGSRQLTSSPLSLGNWQNRIVFPLSFRTLGQSCRLGAAEVPTAGSPLAAEAVYNWQPKLCEKDGPVFGFTPLSSASVEGFIAGQDPGLGLMNEAVPPDLVPQGRKLVYAPLLLSGLVIGVAYDYNPVPGPDADWSQAGRPLTGVKLTPRVVAKLLTASYLKGTADGAPYLLGRPASLIVDPDFLRDNPAFSGLSGTLEVIFPFGSDSVFRSIWQWIMTDKDAADFVAGFPDNLNPADKHNSGMRVNPFYQGADLPQDFFPQLDQYCIVTSDAKGFIAAQAKQGIAVSVNPVCQGDYHQYGTNLSDGAAAALRGDPKNRTKFDPGSGSYGSQPAAGIGQRSVLALTDTASAARYHIAPALLRNGSGSFVGPDRVGLLGGLDAMHRTPEGVLVADPATKVSAAYPLTQVTYAVTRPSVLSESDAKSYAEFVRYAVGDGQTPGSLPGQLREGYAPLPEALRGQARQAADAILARAPEPTESADEPEGDVQPEPEAPGETSEPPATSEAPPVPPPPSPAPSTPLASTQPAIPTAPESSAPPIRAARVARTATTPPDGAGPGRYAVLVVLFLGIGGTLAGPSLPGLVRRLRQ